MFLPSLQEVPRALVDEVKHSSRQFTDGVIDRKRKLKDAALKFKAELVKPIFTLGESVFYVT